MDAQHLEMYEMDYWEVTTDIGTKIVLDDLVTIITGENYEGNEVLQSEWKHGFVWRMCPPDGDCTEYRASVTESGAWADAEAAYA